MFSLIYLGYLPSEEFTHFHDLSSEIYDDEWLIPVNEKEGKTVFKVKQPTWQDLVKVWLHFYDIIISPKYIVYLENIGKNC